MRRRASPLRTEDVVATQAALDAVADRGERGGRQGIDGAQRCGDRRGRLCRASRYGISPRAIARATPWPRRAVPLKHAAANPDLTVYKLKGTAYKFSFLLVPISLPFVWLLFVFRPGVVVYDHAVFVLYSLSFMSLLFIALSLLSVAGLSEPIADLALLVPPVHMALQLRETYRLAIFATLWRTAVLLLVASIVFVLFVLFIIYVTMV